MSAELSPVSEIPGTQGASVIPQHVRYDEKSYMASPDIHLVQMADSTVAGGDSDVFKLDVHIVFGYRSQEEILGFVNWESRRESERVMTRYCQLGRAGNLQLICLGRPDQM